MVFLSHVELVLLVLEIQLIVDPLVLLKVLLLHKN